MKILVPIDFSENSIKTLELALSLNRDRKTTIILVHIVELVYDFASQAAIALTSIHNDANKILGELEKKYVTENIQFQKIIEEGTASISIARLANQNNVDVIMIGSSGAGGFKKLVIGSTTVNLLKEADTPVLVVPAKASLSHLRKLTMAVEFSNHEKSFLDQIIGFKKSWKLDIDFLHVNSEEDFKGELACLGLSSYLEKRYQLESCTVTNLTSNSINEGINSYFESNEGNILVMCHQHKSFWKEFIESSHSLAVTNKSLVPILIMN